MDLVDLFGEANLKTLALATLEDARDHLLAGRPLRAAFSAAHYVQLADRRGWTDAEQEEMARALIDEVRARLKAGDATAAAWRAGYLRLLTGALPWTEAEWRRMVAAVLPRPDLRPWKRVWFAGQCADYHLLTDQAFWDRAQLSQMLAAVREDFALRLRRGDKLMAADRVVLYKVLGQSLPAS